MRRALAAVAAAVALLFPAPALANLTLSKLEPTDYLTPSGTADIQDVQDCGSVTIGPGGHRYFKADSDTYTFGWAEFVGPFHYHGYQTSRITSSSTMQIHTVVNAAHTGWDERAQTGIRYLSSVTTDAGKLYSHVIKAVNQSAVPQNVRVSSCIPR